MTLDALRIDAELWDATRAGARAGRGFRYQDAVAARLLVEAWSGTAPWTSVVPEGLDDLTLHGAVEHRVQLKSRHDPQGTFSVDEVAAYLMKAARLLTPAEWAGSDVHLTVHLERPVAELNATGWEGLAAGEGRERLRASLERLIQDTDTFTTGELLSRAHVVVDANPIDAGVAALAASSSLPPALARHVVQGLRADAGTLADANYRRGALNPGILASSDLQARIDAAAALVGAALPHAIAEGLCEVIDFATPDRPADFYSGVDVTAAHVAAGLVFDRPEVVQEVLDALAARRRCLVAGPSGSGKSAAALLSAYATRHSVRWYRVRRLAETDAHHLVQLARAQDVAEDRPVGFFVDDVGRNLSAAFDELLRETGPIPGLLVLGTVREEDLFTLAELSGLAIVRPRLDEALAERIWAALRGDGDVSFGHWREPFELSRGLLLEYTHLLTRGERLAETLESQVRRRLSEARDLELEILRRVAGAGRYGARIDRQRLQAGVGAGATELARALQRLVDEHALQLPNESVIEGLHELRSAYLDDASRQLLGVPLALGAADVVDVLKADDIALYLSRMLSAHHEIEDALLDAVAARLPGAPSAEWSSALYGLGLATCDRVAAASLAISRAEGIDDRLAWLVLMLAAARTNVAGIPNLSKLQNCVERFAEIEVPDLRCLLIDRLDAPPSFDRLTITEMRDLCGALVTIPGASDPPMVELDIELADGEAVPIDDLLDAILTLNEVDGARARSLVEAAGGTDRLLERVHHATDWSTKPWRGVEDEQHFVAADIVSVSPEVQPDLHADVIALCDRLFAADLDADVVISNAVFPNGTPVGFSTHRVATKRLARENHAVPVRVAWARALNRSLSRLVGAATQTERALPLLAAIGEVRQYLGSVVDQLARGREVTPEVQLRLRLRQLLMAYISPPRASDTARGPLDKGEFQGGDPAHDFVTGAIELAEALAERKFEYPLALSGKASDLAEIADKLVSDDVWRAADSAPVEDLAALGKLLRDVCVILGDLNHDPDGCRRMQMRLDRTSRHNPAAPRLAADARERASRHCEREAERLQSLASAAGLRARVYTRWDDVPMAWPPVEYLLLVEIDQALDWLKSVELLVSVVEAFGKARPVGLAPCLQGVVCPQFALVHIGETINDLSFAAKWRSVIDLPFLEGGLFDSFAATTDRLFTLSAAFSRADRPLNASELTFLESVVSKIGDAIGPFTAAARDEDNPELIDVAIVLSDLYERAVAELPRDDDADVARPHPAGQSLAADLADVMQNPLSDLGALILSARLVLAERDARMLPRLRLATGSEGDVPGEEADVPRGND